MTADSLNGKRPSYTDPLAAAWMAKHFGMRFKFDQPAPFSDTDIERVETNDTGAIVVSCAERYYIHPDSLHLLEPKEGDEGRDILGRQCVYFDGGWLIPVPEQLEFTGRIYSTLRVQIDKRNGIAFHWPESQ